MQPLIRIESVPIKLSFKTTPATFEMAQPHAQLTVTRSRGGFQMRSNPIRVKLDTFEARASTGFKSPRRSWDEFAQESVNAGYEATARIAEDGNMMMDVHIGADVMQQIAYQRMSKSIDTMMAFIPSQGPDIQWEGGDFSIEFQMDKLNLDWQTHRPEMTFIPGSIEITIEQYPDVVIEYIGEPIYVPPSSNPNYQPSALDARA